MKPLSLPSSPSPPRTPHAAILVAVTATGPLALNLFVPSMPGLVASFGTDQATVQLTLTLYLIGVAGGQLIYGPLSDRFGRRPLLLAGLMLYVAAGVMCALAPSIGLLIAGRVAQAIGGCAGMVLSRAIVRDLYGRDQAARVLAYITMAMAVAPAMAPAIGGYLDEWFGWRAGFAVLVAFGGAVLALSLVNLHETHFDRRPLPGLAGLALGYLELARTPAFLGYALNTAFTTSAFFAFLAGAPHIMVDLLHRSPREYGILFVMISVGYMIGNFLAARLSHRLGTERLVAIGSTLSLAATLLLLGLALAGVLSPLAIFVPTGLMGMANGISMPGSVAAAISVNPNVAGTASGLLGFLQMTIGAAATQAVGLLADGTQMPMVGVMVACTTLALAGYRFARISR